MRSERENRIRNARFQGPQWIPMHIVMSDASWDEYRKDMEEVALRHPLFFPSIKKGWRDYDQYEFLPNSRKNQPFTDAWGCVWVTSVNGIIGTVRNAPLANWDELDDYRVPDPNAMDAEHPADWGRVKRNLEDAKEHGLVASGSLEHGFLFMRLYYLRGFENLMIDIAVGEPRLQRLIDVIAGHNEVLVGKYLKMGVDIMEFPDDLGTQDATVMSPDHFRRWIKPAYKKLIAPCKEAGTLVGMHSDGRTLDILEDQIEIGVDIVNPQDLVNGIDNLARNIKGKACILLDVDRQTIVPFGTRKDIHDLIEEEVRKLGDPAGGLEFVAGIYPPTPPQNVDALCEAFEKFRTYWWEKHQP